MTLCRKISLYRCETETEADEVIAKATEDGGRLTKQGIEQKEKKAKGEVIDSWLAVTTQVDYFAQADISEPLV
jgi:hypothetical protein